MGIDQSATESEIKAAYKRQAMKHHPDRGGDEATFKEISKAYEVLSNAEQRQMYDAYGEAGLNGNSQSWGDAQHSDPFQMFYDMFGFNGGRAGPRGKPRTPDSKYELQLSLEELYAGAARNIAFKRDKLCSPCEGYGGHDRSVCPKCRGSGRVVMMKEMGVFVQQYEVHCDSCSGKGYTIPPGKICTSCNGKGTQQEKNTFRIDIEPGLVDGTEFRFRGQADEAPGCDTGDVVIVVRETQHPTFARIQDMLVMTKKISLPEALTGFKFSTKFLDGKDLEIVSTPGEVVRPGDILAMEGKGMPKSHGQRPGNLYIVFEVDFPERLDPDTRKAVHEAFGGPPLEDPPAEMPAARKLTPRQSQELRRRLSQRVGPRTVYSE